MLLLFLALMSVALSEHYFITPISASALPMQLNERRGCVCYAIVPAAPTGPHSDQLHFLHSPHTLGFHVHSYLTFDSPKRNHYTLDNHGQPT